MTQPAGQTTEERARALCAYNGPLFGIIHMTDSQRTIREALLASALADERRRGMEKAAKIADEYPKRDPAEDGNGYWAAEEIAQAIRAQAHAGQEG